MGNKKHTEQLNLFSSKKHHLWAAKIYRIGLDVYNEKNATKKFGTDCFDMLCDFLEILTVFGSLFNNLGILLLVN